MDYVGLSAIMDEVKGKLEESGLFQHISKAAITGVENLFAAIPELAAFPAAIVNTPPQTFPSPGAWRELALEIIVVDKFLPLSMEEKAQSACVLLDAVVRGLTAAEPGKSLKLTCGAHLTVEDIMALAVDSQHTAWLVETKVSSPIIR